MNQAVIPDFFRRIIDQSVNNLAVQAQEQGKRAIACTCSYVPQPLLSLDGLFPIRVRAPGVAGTPMADTYLSSVICSYTRSIMELALEWAFDSLDGWVFTASCDHLRRLYDNLDYLNKPAFNHMIDLPHRGGRLRKNGWPRNSKPWAPPLPSLLGWMQAPNPWPGPSRPTMNIFP